MSSRTRRAVPRFPRPRDTPRPRHRKPRAPRRRHEAQEHPCPRRARVRPDLLGRRRDRASTPRARPLRALRRRRPSPSSSPAPSTCSTARTVPSRAASSNRSARAATPSSSSPPSTTPSTNDRARTRSPRWRMFDDASPASRFASSARAHRDDSIRTTRKNTRHLHLLPPPPLSSARPRCTARGTTWSRRRTISHPRRRASRRFVRDSTRTSPRPLDPRVHASDRRTRTRTSSSKVSDTILHTLRARVRTVTRRFRARRWRFCGCFARARRRIACGENTNAPPGRRSRGWCPRNLTWRSRTIFRRIGCARCPGEGACTRRGFTAAAG